MSWFLPLILLLLFSGDKGDNDYYYCYYDDNDVTMTIALYILIAKSSIK